MNFLSLDTLGARSRNTGPASVRTSRTAAAGWRRARGSICPALLLAAACPAGAAEEIPVAGVLDEVVVIANKHERSIRQVAANVTVVSREDLDTELALSLADVLRYTPGIDYESSGSRFGTEGINIRGIGGNRVAILLDGVPLSDQFDVGSFSNATRDFIDAGFVRGLEILHGPASALYGSSAIGGVVAIRTPDPAELMGTGNQGGELSGTWRDADTSLHGTGMYAFGTPNAGLLLGLSLRDGNEYDAAAVDTNLDTRDYERGSALVKFVANTHSGNTWKLGYAHQDTEVQSDLQSILGSGRFRSTTALEGDDEYRMDLVSAEYHFGEPGGWIDDGVFRAYHQAASVGQSTLDERGLATRPVSIDRYFSFEQDIAGAEINLQKVLSTDRIEHRLGFGLEYRNRRTEEYRDGLETGIDDGIQTSVLLGEAFPLRDFPISRSIEWGAYVEDTLSVGNWTIIAALRADAYELDPELDRMYAEDYPFAEVVSVRESDLSPKLGIVYRLSDKTDVYAQYAHGFRAPPYEDANIGLEIPVFNFRAIPNPDLRSESSDGYDIGLRWHGIESGFHVGAFRTDYEEFIESRVRLGLDPVSGRILFQSRNVNEAVIEGIEGGWRLRLPGALDMLATDASFYLAKGENRDTGQPLNSVGPAQAVIGLDWMSTDGGRHLRLRATATAGWDDRDDSGGELFEPPGFAVFDLFFAQRLGDRVMLRAGLLNLLDREYWTWSDIRGLSPGDPVIPYLSRPGRSLTVGLDINW
ncbi:MAG: TonB-dependent receptor [Gammaproteobacteria bacterium]|nr:TonB-dependent receptor [Gammaproteobacteria bacterium]